VIAFHYPDPRAVAEVDLEAMPAPVLGQGELRQAVARAKTDQVVFDFCSTSTPSDFSSGRGGGRNRFFDDSP
jgi:hypothetical protein